MAIPIGQLPNNWRINNVLAMIHNVSLNALRPARSDIYQRSQSVEVRIYRFVVLSLVRPESRFLASYVESICMPPRNWP